MLYTVKFLQMKRWKKYERIKKNAEGFVNVELNKLIISRSQLFFITIILCYQKGGLP